MAAGRVPRGALARLRRSPLLRWRHRPAAAEELLIAPPDLRTQDPSFVDEIDAGTFGLAGCVAMLRRPLAVRHRAAQRGLGARAARLRLAAPSRRRRGRSRSRPWRASWCANGSPAAGGASAPAWAPDVVGRRVISWLSHAALLLDGADKRPYAAIMRSLDEQVTLSVGLLAQRAGRLSAPAGADRAGEGRPVHRRPRSPARAFRAAAGRRAGAADPARRRPHQPQPGDPGRADARPAAAAPVLRRARHQAGPGAAGGHRAAWRRCCARCCWATACSARFNGVGFTERDALATALAYDESPPMLRRPPRRRRATCALQRGATVIVMDAGAPPDLELAGSACAGCLSFEMSTGSDLLLVNAGRPTAPDAHARALARATASHNTLCLNDQSSSTLIRNARAGAGDRRRADPPSRRRQLRWCAEDEAGIAVEASHDGYAGALQPDARAQAAARRGRHPARRRRHAERRQGRAALRLGPAVRHPLPPASGGRGRASARRPTSPSWRWRPASFGACRRRAPPCRSRTAPISPTSSGPRAAQSIVLRGVCGGTAEVRLAARARRARAGRWTPGRASASARKSGKPKSHAL